MSIRKRQRSGKKGLISISRLGQRRQVVIPKETCKAAGLREGDFVEVTGRKGWILIKPKKLVDPEDTLTPQEEKIVAKGFRQQFRRLPRDRREQMSQAVDEMGKDPLQGDVMPVKSGKFRGTLRKRVGRYRVIFALDSAKRQIEVAAILLRSESTYR